MHPCFALLVVASAVAGADVMPTEWEVLTLKIYKDLDDRVICASTCNVEAWSAPSIFARRAGLTWTNQDCKDACNRIVDTDPHPAFHKCLNHQTEDDKKKCVVFYFGWEQGLGDCVNECKRTANSSTDFNQVPRCDTLCSEFYDKQPEGSRLVDCGGDKDCEDETTEAYNYWTLREFEATNGEDGVQESRDEFYGVPDDLKNNN